MQQDWTRYSCQLALPGFTKEAQQRLQNAKVLIVGAGGLGCPAAQYITAAGVGTIGIADFDVISVSNLHRQILYTPAEVGQKKAIIACKKLQQQNPSVQLIPHCIKITSDNVLDTIAPYDIVIDGTDTIETKYLLNDACVLSSKPLIYGAIYQYEGQVAIWNLTNEDGTKTPNYRDIFPSVNASNIPNCTEGGVIPTLAGIIGCLQANEAIKYLSQTGEVLKSKLLLFDAQTLQTRNIKIGRITKTVITHLQPSAIIPTINAHELKKKIEAGFYQLVDVRSLPEHEAYNIGGTCIPLPELDGNLGQLHSGKPVLFYCATGKRSEEAVRIMKQKVTNEVYLLEGGLKAWQEEG